MSCKYADEIFRVSEHSTITYISPVPTAVSSPAIANITDIIVYSGKEFLQDLPVIGQPFTTCRMMLNTSLTIVAGFAGHHLKI